MIIKKLNASALISTLILTLILTTICVAFLLSVYYYRIFDITDHINQRVSDNLNSSINLVLSDTSYLPETALTENYDLFDNGKDSVCLIKKSWGCFNYAQVSASVNGKNLKKIFLYGASEERYSDACLYLCDNSRPLMLAGKSLIVGKAYLPKSGVKASYIDQRGFEGSSLVNGRIDTSNHILPPFKETFLLFCDSIINTLSGTNFFKNDDNVNTSTDTFKNSFSDSTLIISRKGVVKIDNCLKGNIKVISDSQIYVQSSACLDNVLLIAPIIRFESGFKGNLQCFATDSIIIGQACQFDFPSAFVLLQKKNAKFQARLRIEKNTFFQGCIFSVMHDNNFPKPVIVVDKDVLIKGLIYNSGFLYLSGTVKGIVYSNYFLYQNSSAVFENMLFDAIVEEDKSIRLGSYFSPLNETRKNHIVKWLN